MRLLRALLVALLTAAAGCVLAFFVGDYLTKLTHVPDREGERAMTIVFLCAPVGILVGLLIGIVSAILVRREKLAGFLIAQGWSLLVVCVIAGLSAGIPYCSPINRRGSTASGSCSNSSYASRPWL